MTKRHVRRPQHKRVLISAPPMVYACLLLVLCPLLSTAANAAEDTKETLSKQEKARKGHVFTDEDLVFDTVYMHEPGAAPKPAHHPISLTATFSRDNPSRRFSAFYEPAQVSLETPASGYPLPIDEDEIVNLNLILDQTSINYYGRKTLLEQGFLSVNSGDHDDFVEAYESIAKRRLPLFITSDSVLHLYQLHFSASMDNIEKFTLATDLENLTRAFVKEFNQNLSDIFSAQLNLAAPPPTDPDSSDEEAVQQNYERQKADLAFQEELYGTGLAYFSVALALTDPKAKIHPHVADRVRQEIALIHSHPGKQFSPVLGSEIDYRLFKPEGDSKANPRIQAYHSALAWYRNMPLSIAPPLTPPEPTSDSEPNQTSRLQPILAATIVGLLGEMEFQSSVMLQGEPSQEKMKGPEIWERMLSIYGFFEGASLELAPNHFITALRSVFPKRTFDPLLLNDEETFQTFMQELHSSSPAPTHDSGAKAFYLFGASSLPEEEIFRALTHPAVKPRPRIRSFTTFYAEDNNSYLRAFPRGLDLVSALGIPRAAEILELENDTRYPNYPRQIATQQDRIASFSTQDWHRDRYWSWLYMLKILMRTQPPTSQRDLWPGFMTSSAWPDRQIHTALASWVAMHQAPALLTQSDYSEEFEADAPTTKAQSPDTQDLVRRSAYQVEKRQAEREREELTAGYVDPAPHVYAELAALTRMIQKGMMTFGTLDKNSERRLSDLESLLIRLQEIAQDEITGQKSSDDDVAFLHSFAENFSFAVGATDPSSRTTIALTHLPTAPPSTEVLHEASGLLRMILVVYKHPGGQLAIGVGPISSYYEFKRAPENKLSGAKWRKMVERGKQFDPPEWTESFLQ